MFVLSLTSILIQTGDGVACDVESQQDMCRQTDTHRVQLVVCQVARRDDLAIELESVQIAFI